MKLEDFKIDSIKSKPILILDFGSQYTQLIARRLREMRVYCEIHPYFLDLAYVKKFNPCGIILSGGPASVTSDSKLIAPDWVFDLQVPILGICYGMQTMAVQLGGKVSSSSLSEFGHTQLTITAESSLFEDISEKNLDVWMSHGDQVVDLPPGFKTICSTQNTPIAGFSNESKHWYGIQFHPEVTHTPKGVAMLRRFVLDICAANTNWTSGHIITEAVQKIRQDVGNSRVLLGLSGGVDSSVVAALIHHAIGSQLVCVFVDTGLLRSNEASLVQEMFQDNLKLNIIWVKAEDRFLQALKGVVCPEEKRKIIGKTFIDVFEEEAKKLGDIAWLAQGTIYPDVIESAAVNQHGTSTVIKSHHNVGGLPLNMRLKLLEPIRELFKDEVRQVGLELGLSSQMINRHPFPGPGLGVRILGEVKKEYTELLRAADQIFLEELSKAQLYNKVSQAFAVFLPVKSVGVMGDGREYGYVICLRAVETKDFMTASWSHLPWDFLSHVSNRIINEIKGISRVTYDISGKPPATIEWE